MSTGAWRSVSGVTPRTPFGFPRVYRKLAVDPNTRRTACWAVLDVKAKKASYVLGRTKEKARANYNEVIINEMVSMGVRRPKAKAAVEKEWLDGKLKLIRATLEWSV